MLSVVVFNISGLLPGGVISDKENTKTFFQRGGMAVLTIDIYT